MNFRLAAACFPASPPSCGLVLLFVGCVFVILALVLCSSSTETFQQVVWQPTAREDDSLFPSFTHRTVFSFEVDQFVCRTNTLVRFTFPLSPSSTVAFTF